MQVLCSYYASDIINNYDIYQFYLNFLRCSLRIQKNSMFSRMKDCEDEYVDIHGRHIPTVLYKRTGERAFPLIELKQTGVRVYQKSQYAKLATIKKQFDDEFNLHMLESAKIYMLSNKIAFTEDQILRTINNCKQKLSENKTVTPKQHIFKNRVIEERSDDEILIQFNVTQSSPNATSSTACSRRPITPKVSKELVFKDSDKLNVYLEAGPKQNKEASQNKLPNKEEHYPTKWQNGENSKENDSKNDGVQPKFTLRQPRSKVLDKGTFNEQSRKEHEVIVTCIHKRNCIWVRDKANQEIFEKIHRLVNEEAKFQKTPQKPWEQEKVYMAPDESFWFRCKIIRFNPLTVFFLDYGNMAEVEEIKEVSEELAQIPCMAVRITFKEADYYPCLEDEITIQILKQNEDGTYYVNVLKQVKTPEESTWKFFKIPPPMNSLENGQKVVISHVENGVFFLRTKDCFKKLKEIEEKINKYADSAEIIDNVEVNQLVLVHDDFDELYYRAVVTQTKNDKVELKYLDYNTKTTVNVSTLKNINESLSHEPVTYFEAKKLKGFENEELTGEDKAYIQKIIEKRKKFAVILNDAFDLFDGSSYLSDQLGKRKNDSKKIRLKDMKTFSPEFGTRSYVCGCYKNSADFTLVPSQELSDNIDSVLIMDIEDPEPYTPIVGEVCFCFYTDQWYRCVVTRTLGSGFEVVLLDFGNVEVMRIEELRKPNDKITEIPVLALPCKLINLPDHPKVEELLKKMVLDGELYNVEIKSITNGKYNTEIPTVYQQIIQSI